MKSLFKNSIYFVGYRLINVIYPLITATYVSRVLKPAGVGEAALAQNIVIFLVAVALLGIPNYGIREISKTSENDIDRLFTELFLINFVSTLIISILYYSTIDLLCLELNRKLYRIYGIILLFNVINVDWFYQGKEEFKYITIRSAIVKAVSVVAIFVFVRDETDICAYGLIFALAYVGNYTFNAINLKKYVDFSFKNLNIKRHLNSIFALSITAISNEIYVTLDTFMLGVLSTNTEIGYYSNSMKLMRILINVVTAFGAVILPRLSKLQHKKDYLQFNIIINKVINILLWVTIPCTIGIILLSETIVVVLFGRDFAPASCIMIILSFLIIPRAFSNLSLQVLVCTKNDTKTSKVYFTGMLINCVLNLIFIRYIGAKGAAVASVISEVYICLVLFNYSKELFIYKRNKKYVFSLMMSVISMLVLVKILEYCMLRLGASLMSILIICIITGIFEYVAMTLLTQNEVTLFFISKLKQKVGRTI